MTTGNIYNIMIGSPSDVEKYAKIAIDCITHWNIMHSSEKRIALVPLHWTTSSYPSLQNKPQQVLNEQLVNNSDALIAVFGTRIGTPTDKYPGGTAEEIDLHRKANKPVMVLFCESTNNPFNVDTSQLQTIQEYRRELQNQGLCAPFTSEEDFRFKLNDYLHRLVQDKFCSNDSVSNSKMEESVSFSDKEIDILKKWCSGNNTTCTWVKFMGGGCHFRFGNMGIDTTTGSEYAEIQDFIARMVAAGFIAVVGYDSHNKPKYELQHLAYKNFANT